MDDQLDNLVVNIEQPLKNIEEVIIRENKKTDKAFNSEEDAVVKVMISILVFVTVGLFLFSLYINRNIKRIFAMIGIKHGDKILT